MKDKDKVREYNKAYHAAHKEKANLRSKEYYHSVIITQAKDIRYFLNLLIRPDRGRGHITIEYLMKLWEQQKGLCDLSGVPMTSILGQGMVDTNASIDRIDNDRDYDLDNIHLVCFKVNSMKMKSSISELHWWCEQIIKIQGR